MCRKMKRLLLIAVLCFVAVMALINLSMVTNAASSTVNLAASKQFIRGFGASSAWCGAINDSVMNSLYTTLGYSILRVRIEDQIGDAWKSGNYSSWANEVSNAKKASQRGAIVFASPWNPPASMQEGFSKSGDADAKRLRYDQYGTYVQYLNAYVTNMKNNGVDLYAISVQNEPDYANDWTWWTPTEMLNFMKNNAGSINCRVMAPESFQYLKNMSDPILNDATALANMDILGCHFYGTSVSNMAYPLFQQKGAGKEVWMTEKYFDDDTIGNIMALGTEIHNAMVTGNMNAYVYWWITWANGLATSSGTIYKRAYVIGQYSKYIRPGFYRVDATANPATNVYVSAYKGNNQVVIVAINTGTSSVSQSFSLQNGTASQVSSWITDSGRNMSAGSTLGVSGGSFTATLPAQSISTFVGSLSGVTGTPTSTPTPTRGGASPTPTPTQIPGTISIAAGRTSALGSFQADQYYSGGSTYNNTNTVDVSQITSNPPPAALFNNERYGAMSYTIPGFTAGNSYTVTLYFAETYLTSSGSRRFNVSINGATVLSNFDIYATAGGQNKAIARPFTATANSSGQIVIQFTSVTENPKINGISIKPVGSNPTPTPTPTPTSRPTSTQAPTPTPTPTTRNSTPTPTAGPISIAAGRTSALGSFRADQWYSGGSTYANSNTVDVSQIPNGSLPQPPAALFNNERYGAFSYTIPSLAAGRSYTVALYFAETYLTSSGSRLFSVSINGATVLSNFDIYASAGGQNKAIARTFTTTANSSGQIVIQFISGTQNPKINGISIH